MSDTEMVHVKVEPGLQPEDSGRKGTCRIKAEYLRKERDMAASLKRSWEASEDPLSSGAADGAVEEEHTRKRVKMEPTESGGSALPSTNDEVTHAVKPENLQAAGDDVKPVKSEIDDAEDASIPTGLATEVFGTKKKRRGQFKDRPIVHSLDPLLLCNDLAVGRTCQRPQACRYSHDIPKYLQLKGPDLGSTCPFYEKFGRCKFGLKCRFAGAHTDKEGKQMVKEGIVVEDGVEESWGVTREFQKKVRQKALPLRRSERFLKWLSQNRTDKGGFRRDEMPNVKSEAGAGASTTPVEMPKMKSEAGAGPPTTAVDVGGNVVSLVKVKTEPVEEQNVKMETGTDSGAQAEDNASHDVKLEKFDDQYSIHLFPEMNEHKKTIDFRGKTYLAPLTTVGNLPFRRVCKRFGVDITCGEMAMANNLLSGQNTEWALCRRHKSEDLFGVQLAGSQAATVVKAAEAIEQGASVDFIDLNVGCPVDSITRYGCGSALLEKKAKLFDILQGCNYACNVPVTVKLRMGVLTEKPITHKMIDMLKRTGVQAITLHGRSKAQRYTKLADWNYIDKCARLAGDDVAFFGNGDVLSWEEHQERLNKTRVHGIMIGRGALIKPWIFEEIKDRKVKDIRSTERLEILKDFANFGLEHWGSDTLGVNTTRRFMCEWLSFLYRYVPVGLLEVLPQRMNERPPPFFGRDDLETLMASPNAADWVKITELVLGKAPEDFNFVPKHRSNAYETDDYNAEG